MVNEEPLEKTMAGVLSTEQTYKQQHLEDSEQKKTDRKIYKKVPTFFFGAWDAADETVQAGAIGVDLQLMGGTGEGSYHFDQRHAHGACAVLSFLFEGHVA